MSSSRAKGLSLYCRIWQIPVDAGLSSGSEAAPLLGLRVRIPGVAWMSVVSTVCWWAEVSETGRSLVQRLPTVCGVSECDCEASIMRRNYPTRGCCVMGGWGVYCEIWGSDSGVVENTGLFEMIVRVLTTCHTQYTWDSSICFLLFNRTTLPVYVTYLTGALYVHPLWFYRINRNDCRSFNNLSHTIHFR